MQQKSMVDWLHHLLKEHVDCWSSTNVDEIVSVVRTEGDEMLVITDDGEHAQTWIVSVRPTVRACEVPNTPS